MQSKRDSFVCDPQAARLSARIRNFLVADDDHAREIFHDTRDRKWVEARAIPFEAGYIRNVAYRPLDQRYLYNHRAYGDFLRPDLQEAWGNANVCLYALPSGTGAGPAVWCHGLLPDYHAFRGSYGGYAFPLHDRRLGGATFNLSSTLIESLSAAYGEQVAAADVFDAILCLLSAATYSLRFAEDLEDVFPHIPFPTQHTIFAEAARVGREIRSVEAFARQPNEAYRRPAFVRMTTQPRSALAAVDYADGAIILCDDGTGKITGLPQTVWDFSVSGYRVLPRWLEARVGSPVDLAFVRELRDICGRIAELIDLFAEADIVLGRTLQESLTREALGLADARQEIDDGRD